MTLTKLKKELFEDIYKLNTNISKSSLRKVIDEFGLKFSEEYISRTIYAQSRNSKDKWKSRAEDLIKVNANLREGQRILGLAGKLKK